MREEGREEIDDRRVGLMLLANVKIIDNYKKCVAFGQFVHRLVAIPVHQEIKDILSQLYMGSNP